MNSQQAFDQLAFEFNLKPADYFFLDLIPVIEMIWADGKNQEDELKILYQIVIEHIAYLDKEAGIHVVSIDDANDFLKRFAHNKPSSRLVHELRVITMSAERASFNQRKDTIYDYCLDIAAACVNQYPYKLQGRIINKEKDYLQKLFKELGLSTNKKVTSF